MGVARTTSPRSIAMLAVGLLGCVPFVRFDAARGGFEQRPSGRHAYVEMFPWEIGTPGGVHAQQVTIGSTLRFAFDGTDPYERIGLFAQGRAYLWRYMRGGFPFYSDVRGRDAPVGAHEHLQLRTRHGRTYSVVVRYAGMSASEWLAVGVLGEIGPEWTGTWRPTTGSRSRFVEQASGATASAGLFAMGELMGIAQLSLEGGWMAAFDQAGPFVRLSLAVGLTVSIDRSAPEPPFEGDATR